MRINTNRPNTARYVPIESVEYIGKADVYNMEVLNHHNFTVDGGFLVHNCMDADRYFLYTVLFKKHAKVKDKIKEGLR